MVVRALGAHTVDRIVSNGVPYLLDYTLPATFFDIVGIRDYKASFIVVFLVIPAMKSVTNTDMLFVT